MDLAEFLLARIAEDEAAAQAAFPSPWEFDGVSSLLTPDGPQGLVMHPYLDGETQARTPVAQTELFGARINGKPTAAHIARHDPARVLAECSAKRRIVTECGWVTVMALLALPYADHPAYRDEWRP